MLLQPGFSADTMSSRPLIFVSIRPLWHVVLIALMCAGGFRSAADPVLGPWVPLFKGIDRISGTNTPNAANPDRSVLNAVRVDLNDPDIRLMSTPRISNYVADYHETGGMTVSRFLQSHKAQVAINGNFFDQTQYYVPEGSPMDLYGLAISDGVVVSAQESAANSAVLTVDASNVAAILHTNWPAHSTTGIHTALAGGYPVVIKGVNIGRQYLNQPSNLHDANPRTLFGLSTDRRFLYLVAIDGRQAGYSDGALDYEAGNWLLKLGVADGINMDGGGSTTLVMQDSLGNPLRLNRSSAVADSGKERTVGSHLAVFANPLPGFISQPRVIPDDVATSVTWTTAASAISWVEYGPTTDLGLKSPVPTTPGTVQGVVLGGLTEGTQYYYRVVATSGAQTYTTDIYTFTTTSFDTAQSYIVMTNDWRYTTLAQTDSTWTAPGFNEASWGGPSPALLWVDVRAAGPDALVQPRNTQLASDPSNGGYPFITYYFRTHFQVTDVESNRVLKSDAFIDDGAVFYLNGVEAYRLRMDPGVSILSSTLANGYPCSGDATCLDSFALDGSALVNGDNVLAVEVHNYNASSPDITFGMTLSAIHTAPPPPRVEIAGSGGTLRFDWTRGGFVLQQADAPTGPWADVPGPIVAGPYTNSVTGSARFYRLNR